ncbi:MAG: inositol monophosphatase family protein [Alphaproteobacteria bacterium]
MRALLFHNPSAGKESHSQRELVALLGEGGYDVGYSSTKSEDFVERLDEPADLVVIAGGDGTIRKVATLLPDRSIPVGILPLGTANNIARSLGIGGSPKAIVDGWRSGRTRRLDVGTAEGPWGTRGFLEAVGWGALAASNCKASGKAQGKDKLRHGREVFIRTIRESKPHEQEIEIDGRPIHGRWILIEALNIRSTGPRLVLGARAEPADGMLDVVCVGEEQRSDLLEWLAGPEDAPSPVEALRGRHVRLDWDGMQALRIDDKAVDPLDDGKAAAVTIALQEVPLSILLGPDQEGKKPKARTKGQGKPMKAKAKTKPMDAADVAEIPEKLLHEIERVAVEFANLAGAEIASALGGMLAVRYKGESEAEQVWRDPVSEIDHRVEQLIRTRLADRFPDHGVIGEEIDEPDLRDFDVLWVIDPIDGTANFVNGFPLFAASIGVLLRGRPVAGALWCATGHALRAGVYHACAGGVLRFDGDTVVPRSNPAVRRRLAGVPHSAPERGAWDTRKTGSASIECAFVAAGLLEAARFDTPNLWDVAGGAALVQASGGDVLTRSGEDWTVLDRFEAPQGTGGKPDLRRWKQPLMIGRVGAKALISGLGA